MFSYRIQGGLAVESDYIVTVKPAANADQKTGLFEPFTISKTYSAFRTLGQQLKKAADACRNKKESLPAHVSKVCKYCDLAFNLVDSQRTAYLGKVNYMYVKVLTKQRKQILDDVLAASVSYFPSETNSHALLEQVACIVETFFLTDHVDSELVGSKSERGFKRSGSASSRNSKGEHHNLLNPNLLNPLTWIGGNSNESKSPKLSVDTGSASNDAAVVVPITRRNRQSVLDRSQEEHDLQKIGEEANLLVDDDRAPAVLPNYSKPTPTTSGTVLENTNPFIFVAIAVVVVAFLQVAMQTAVSMDGDIFLLVIFASFCLGLHTPRPGSSLDRSPAVLRGTVRGDRSGRQLLRRSMLASTPTAMRRASEAVAGLKVPSQPSSLRMDMQTAAAIVEEEDEGEDAGGMILMEEEDEAILGSPMAVFPEGAKLGSHSNCWSRPDPTDFHVRGPNYMVDKKKVKSGDYIFPCRGLDLFLTDACPQNVGRNTGVLGGALRELPTFIINFRLPWGVLLIYCEIPNKFVPFVEAQSSDEAKKKMEPKLKELSPPERAVARWVMADRDHKNQTLKIVPVVVVGPWVVKSVVGGKPALIGEKLPIDYVYQPAEGNKALYIEADLDIAASSAARGILSVTRSYTQSLTIDLGFVIQGNSADDLPEQMLVGARLHGIDPLTAPCLPPMDDDLFFGSSASDEDSV